MQDEYNYEITIKCISQTKETRDKYLELMSDTLSYFTGNENLTLKYDGPISEPLYTLTYSCVANNDIEALKIGIDNMPMQEEYREVKNNE